MSIALISCRECGHQVSPNAHMCPNCGAPEPHKQEWKGTGFYWKSKTQLLGMPLVCISFCYKKRMPIPAVGVIAIGQFAAGIINVSQFGIGLFSLSQFTVSAFAVAQFALAYKCVAQIGFAFSKSIGQQITYLF